MKNNLQKIPLLLSATLFIFFCFAFFLLYQKINNNNKKTEQENLTWQTEARRRDDIKFLNHSLQKITENKVLFETHFAESSDIVPFLNMIEKLGPKVGAKTEVNSVDILTNKTGLVVGLKASGSFEAIYKFIMLLENSPYELDFLLMDVHKLTIEVVPGKNIKSSDWEAVFKIQLLSFIP